MKKYKQIPPNIKEVCYNSASTFVMNYRFQIEVEFFEIFNIGRDYVTTFTNLPTDNFTKDSFIESAGQMKEINKILLIEKMKQYALISFSMIYGNFKISSEYCTLRYIKGQENECGYWDAYVQIHNEMDRANDLLGYKHFTAKHFNAWTNELNKLMKGETEIWMLVKKVAEYLIELYQGKPLIITGKELEQKFKNALLQIQLQNK